MVCPNMWQFRWENDDQPSDSPTYLQQNWGLNQLDDPENVLQDGSKIETNEIV